MNQPLDLSRLQDLRDQACSIAHDAFLIVAAIVGGLAVFFVLAAFVSDYAWPWIDDLWHARNARPQATYKSRDF